MNDQKLIIQLNEQFSVSNFLIEEELDNQRKEIITGLNADKKYIISKFFYDDAGSSLF